MDYSTGRPIKIGDHVLADGMTGIVVCDFDHREFLDGHDGWDMPEVEMLGGGRLNSGVMINTEVAGLIHYPEPTEGIVFVES